MKNTKVNMEDEQHEILHKNRLKTGKTLDFQMSKAIELYTLLTPQKVEKMIARLRKPKND
jgi:hypothetical protein